MTGFESDDTPSAKPARAARPALDDRGRAVLYLLVLALAVLALAASSWAFGLAGLILPVLALVPVSFVVIVLITLG